MIGNLFCNPVSVHFSLYDTEIYTSLTIIYLIILTKISI